MADQRPDDCMEYDVLLVGGDGTATVYQAYR